MQDFLSSVGCLVFVWGLPILSVGLVIKMVIEIRQERTRRQAEAARREIPGEDIWPPPPEAPRDTPE